jgi:hypothetical protein
MIENTELPVEKNISIILIDYAIYCCYVLIITFIALITVVMIDGGKVPVSSDAALVIYAVGLGAAVSIVIGCYPFAKKIMKLHEELK